MNMKICKITLSIYMDMRMRQMINITHMTYNIFRSKGLSRLFIFHLSYWYITSRI